MEIKVRDYVRFDGEIAKITNIKRYKTKEDIFVFDRILDLNEDRACNDNTIYNSQWQYFDNVKSSPNIIDLIEVGDYVNGQLVMEIYEKNSIYNGSSNYKFKERTLELFNTDYECIPHEFLINNKRIESILTKEQFSSMEYKIND